jgi:hypothetical protein
VKALFTRCATAISQQSTARYSKMGRRSALARHFLTKGHCASAAQHICGGWRQRQPAMTVRIRQQKPLREQLADYTSSMAVQFGIEAKRLAPVVA